MILDSYPKEALCDANIKFELFYEALYMIELDYHNKVHNKGIDITSDSYRIYFDKLTLRYEKIYSNINESDGILGISSFKSAKKQTYFKDNYIEFGLKSILPEITFNKASQNLQCLNDCYKFIEMTDNNGYNRIFDDLYHDKAKNIDDFNMESVNYDDNLYYYKRSEDLNDYAYWKSENWLDLNYMNDEDFENNIDINVTINNLIFWMIRQRKDKFEHSCQKIYSKYCETIQRFNNLPNSYHLCYKYISHCHIIQILRDIFPIFSKSFNLNNIVELFAKQIDFLDTILDDHKYKENFYIVFRKAILTLINLNKDINNNTKYELSTIIGDLFLESANLTIDICPRASYYNLLNGRYYGAIKFNYYMAQWQWIHGDKFEAQKRLILFLEETNSLGQKDFNECIYRAKILLGNYMEQSGSADSDKIVSTYLECCNFNPCAQEAYFYLGRHFENVKYNLINSSNVNFDKLCEITYSIIKNYCTSISNGSKYVFQTILPLFTNWMDFDETINSLFILTESQQNKSLLFLNKMTQSITFLRKTVNIVTFLPVIPNLISRITHPNCIVYEEIKQILSNVMIIFPQQVIWHLVSQWYSSHKLRSTRCQEILDFVLNSQPKMKKFIQDTLHMSKLLLDMCTRKIPYVAGKQTYLISEYFPDLIQLINSSDFSKIIIPTENQLRLYGMTNVNERDFIYISGISPHFSMLHSLQRPKKFALLGSDGQYYTMLCKPNDDLRKDARLMEINNLLNAFLKIDSGCQKRNLHINTYSVLPLNDESGLIQWIENTSGYGNIVKDIYAQKGISVSPKQLKEVYYSLSTPLMTKKQIFTDKLLKMHPDVFHEWFFDQFPDPRQWFNAKLAFIRTFAVMSIVGYILGLGDRHGENILFNSSNGECMHVDFNCLFNRGESLDWPELVPFRLTHNLISAMGPHGYDGFFRVACEKTLKIMRVNKEALMCMLETFIHDPLLEWSKVKISQVSHSANSTTSRGAKKSKIDHQVTPSKVMYSEKNSEAMIHMENCRRRLEGQVWKITGSKKKTALLQSGSLKLSEHGQVDFLINEAINIDNLAPMFIGWAAYM